MLLIKGISGYFKISFIIRFLDIFVDFIKFSSFGVYVVFNIHTFSSTSDNLIFSDSFYGN